MCCLNNYDLKSMDEKPMDFHSLSSLFNFNKSNKNDGSFHWFSLYIVPGIVLIYSLNFENNSEAHVPLF